jgi:hypothetical protein
MCREPMGRAACSLLCYECSRTGQQSLCSWGSAYKGDLDTVQRLNLDSLTWQPMQLKLPQADYWFPCFQIDPQMYLVIEKALYSFTPSKSRQSRLLLKVFSV